jgi:hypothetical protein
MLNDLAPSTQCEGDGGMRVKGWPDTRAQKTPLCGDRGGVADYSREGLSYRTQLAAGVGRAAGAGGGGDAGIVSPGFKMCLTSTLM